jgi:FkbM family methyltransferase
MFRLLKTVPSLKEARGHVQFIKGGLFEMEILEPYWGPAIVGGRDYEPEVMDAMRRFARLSKAFIDCGANYGFWSIVATSSELGFTRTIAVEASPSTFERLRANAALNGDRFVCVNRAISDTTGQPVFLDEQYGHVQAYVSGNAAGTTVLTATIDALIDEHGWHDLDSIVLKIDVEGQEAAAIRGAAGLASTRDHVWVFEDFARGGLETLRLLAELGYATFYLRHDRRCFSVPSVSSAMRALEGDRRPGNARNFAAAKPGSAFYGPLKAWSLSAG